MAKNMDFFVVLRFGVAVRRHYLDGTMTSGSKLWYFDRTRGAQDLWQSSKVGSARFPVNTQANAKSNVFAVQI